MILAAALSLQKNCGLSVMKSLSDLSAVGSEENVRHLPQLLARRHNRAQSGGKRALPLRAVVAGRNLFIARHVCDQRR